MHPPPLPAGEPSCPDCGKPPPVCICDRTTSLDTRLQVVILQHPGEQDALLGTARLLTRQLTRARLRVGLSWASLDHALGLRGGLPARWAVLAVARPPAGARSPGPAVPVVLVDRKGRSIDLARHGLHGFIVLDGTWSQAKSLWWRNPWLTKLPRLLLAPREPTMYGRLRAAPRREWVSTLEAVADVLPALGEPEAVRTDLRRTLRTMLQRVRDAATPLPTDER